MQGYADMKPTKLLAILVLSVLTAFTGHCLPEIAEKHDTNESELYNFRCFNENDPGKCFDSTYSDITPKRPWEFSRSESESD